MKSNGDLVPAARVPDELNQLRSHPNFAANNNGLQTASKSKQGSNHDQTSPPDGTFICITKKPAPSRGANRERVASDNNSKGGVSAWDNRKLSTPAAPSNGGESQLSSS